MSDKQCQPTCEHKIKAGDTFYELAVAYYGDGKEEKVKKIQDANPKVDPQKLQIGQSIKIPA
ncbi:MAG: LysM domain-containing protein [Oscillatoriaceae cyanobacterium Prado104]|jgi:nucleoid-associated protein YgaU|nr:LysM domain-containing protein [Oscillatoriaceae cyanobacterium Prado104]